MKNEEKIKKIIYFLISIENQMDLDISNIKNNKRYEDFHEKCREKINEIYVVGEKYFDLVVEKIFKLINKKDLKEIIDLFSKIKEEFKQRKLIDNIEKSIIEKLNFEVVWNYICLSEKNLEWFFQFHQKYGYNFYNKIKRKHIYKILPILKNIKIYDIPIDISKKIVEFYPKEIMIKINEGYQYGLKEIEINYNYHIDKYYYVDQYGKEIKTIEYIDDYVKKITSITEHVDSIYKKCFKNIIFGLVTVFLIVFILPFRIIFDFKYYYRMIVKDSLIFENKKENKRINIWLSNMDIIDKIEDIDFILNIVDKNYFKKNKYKIKENELKILKMNKII